MRWHKSFSPNAHNKRPPWGYEETLERINKVQDKFWYNFFIASYATGGRQGEVAQLKASDITITKTEKNTEQMLIHLQTEKMREKAFAFRDQPINPNYSTVELSLFETMKDIKNKAIDQDKLLFERTGVQPKSLLALARRFSQKYLGINHHFFRHCRLTHCVTIFGFNEYQLMQYAGWTHPEYAAWYVRLNYKDIQRAMGV